MTPGAKRDAVAHLCREHEVSQRRACSVLGVDRSSVRYHSVRPDDADLRTAMKAVAAERRRFGYRRVHVMLERQGWQVNQKKLRRLYREEKLQVRKRGGRKRALGTRRPMLVPERPNERWSLDFVSDAFTDGRRFRFWPSSMTSAGNALHWSRTPRSPGCASRGNSPRSWRNADGLERLSATTSRN